MSREKGWQNPFYGFFPHFLEIFMQNPLNYWKR